jgi:hypothetical protein
MQNNIFIDDYRNPSDITWVELPNVNNWIVVRSYDEFVVLFEKLPIRSVAHISYDHDLVPAHYANHPTTERTGFDCAKFIVARATEEGIDIPNFTVHSLNPLGRTNITELLENYRKFQLESSNNI